MRSIFEVSSVWDRVYGWMVDVWQDLAALLSSEEIKARAENRAQCSGHKNTHTKTCMYGVLSPGYCIGCNGAYY